MLTKSICLIVWKKTGVLFSVILLNCLCVVLFGLIACEISWFCLQLFSSPVAVNDSSGHDRIKQFSFDYCYWSANPADPHYCTQEQVFLYFYILCFFYVLDWVFEPESMLGVLVQVTIYNCVFGWQTELIYAEVVRSIVALLYSDMYY